MASTHADPLIRNLSEEEYSKVLDLKQTALEWIQTWLAEEKLEAPPSEVAMGLEDSTYLRFLRARNWDKNLAFEMYKATAKWRMTFQGMGVHNATEDTVVNELKSGKSFFYQYDKKNRTVVYVKPRLHIPGAASPEEMERYIVWHMEIGKTLLKPGVLNGLVVYDMNGFGLKNMDYQTMKTQIALLQNFYPESMGLTLVVNSPWIFSACWRILSGWIDPVAAKKILFIKQEELTQFIDKDKLLVEYGGTDPFVYEYKTKAEREGTDWVPSWEMPWATEWKQHTEAIRVVTDPDNEAECAVLPHEPPAEPEPEPENQTDPSEKQPEPQA